MITFRYHVISLVAVLLALAVGIALGGGPLQRTAGESATSDSESLVATQSRLNLLLETAGFADAYAEETAGQVLARALDGRAVTLLTLPGADDADAQQLTRMVGRAGGSVTARAAIDEKLLDVGERQLVSELATQLADSVGKAVEMPADVTGYDQLAVLVAHALSSANDEGGAPDEAAESILAGLETAGLITVTGDVGARGSLVLVLTGEPYGSPDDRQGAGSILSTLVSGLDQRSDGVVVAGPVESSAEDGLVGTVRADPATANEISTVDAVERTAGAVVAVLALRAEAGGTSGHYGTGAAGDGAVPGSRSE